MIKLRSVLPYFIMIICPAVIYYFVLQEQALPSYKTSPKSVSTGLSASKKTKSKIKLRSVSKAGKQGDFAEKFFHELGIKNAEGQQDLLQQLLVLEPFHQSALLALKDETLSWLSTLEPDQQKDILSILKKHPSHEWQENLDTLQNLPADELRTALSQRRMAQKAPKENLDQRPFDTL